MTLFNSHATPCDLKELTRRALALTFALSFVLWLFAPPARPQTQVAVAASPSTTAATTSVDDTLPQHRLFPVPDTSFKLERINVAGEGELLTIFGSRDFSSSRPVNNKHHQGKRAENQNDDALSETSLSTSSLSTSNARSGFIPLVSVLRDTMGDADATNDRLRQVWMLSYAKPSAKQRLAAAIPFFYSRAGNRSTHNLGVPPAVIDLGETDRDVWRKLFWTTLRSLVLSGDATPLRAATDAYRRNADDYRKSHVLRALAVMWLYESQATVKSAFTPTELAEINARLALSEATFGGIVDDIFLQRVYTKRRVASEDARGHTFELLRQRAEAERLFFQPVTTPSGDATHAVLWVRRDDLPRFRFHNFNRRFLNIANPFTDARLRKWKGYTATWHFNSARERIAPDDSQAQAVEMIPLAVYGLEHPKIPILLVDFRDRFNPKRREVSRRALEDVTRHLLGLARFGDLYYFLGRTVYDFALGRRGIDINQPSRLQSYSQLKLLLALDSTLDEPLRDELEKRIETVAVNPFQNDADTETRIAVNQYQALIDYARQPDGMRKLIIKNRRRELRRQGMSVQGRVLSSFAEYATLGLYQPQASWNDAARSRLNLARQLDFHIRFLRQAAESPQIEIAYDINQVRESLRFIKQNGERANRQTAVAVARIFARTEDRETQRLCLDSLYRIDNTTAKTALLRINRSANTKAAWRDVSREYLRQSLAQAHKFKKQDAQFVESMK